jgi:hypothetical protein
VAVCGEEEDFELVLARTNFVIDVNLGEILLVDAASLTNFSLSLVLDRRFSFAHREHLMTSQLESAIHWHTVRAEVAIAYFIRSRKRSA